MDGETHAEVMIPQKVESLCAQLRRNSTGIMAAPNLQPPILSRYLRASMGSCHDMCKYGRKHNSEATTNYLRSRRKAAISQDLHNRDKTSAQLEGNEKSLANVDKYPDSVIVKKDDSWSTPDRDVIVKKAAISGDRYDQDKTSAFLEEKEKSLVNVDESPKSVIVKRDDSLSTQDRYVIVKKTAISADLYDQDKTSALLEGKEKSLVTVDESSRSVIVKRDDSLSTLDRDVSFQQPEDPDVTGDFAAGLKENSVHPSPSTHAKEGTGDKVPNETGGALSVAAPKSSSSRKNQKIRSTKATRVSVNEKEKILPSTASIAPERSSRRGSNRETRNYKHSKLASNQKDCSISNAKPKVSNCEDKTEKTSDFAVADVGNKMAGTTENSVHTLDESPNAEKERRSNEKIAPQLRPSSGKNKLRRSVNACGLAKLPPSSDMKNTRRIGRQVNQSPSSSSLRLTPSPSTSKSTNGDTPSEHEAAEKGNPEARSNTNRPKRVNTGSSEVKNCQPQNLPFRRGKVVEPRLENVVPPRKLRFRRPRLLGECQIGKGDAGRRIFRRKDIDSLELKSIKSEKIVLKHRHVEKRENAQSLFNNVIEETASKLVETRKSKVKALVGAFETVISLQDTKPKATVTAC
ncbi:uncharacterized protein LOC115663860 [Syzygium oleosum]|uniref:uncharacterized protein LOC115663860 n=1 Tax=Syzygium oleosum TaxID=219896 RepID=UPI0011D1C706|nr:uncharacterized protein LOC115663860 [Syzygium oleosum]XP_030441698.1 uncharacterized protein LOC115663860 [Syzygium oleosum]XP_030441699.1 uncharacterized protein LOC115663860 [Syzygium oleosum]XP_056175161.1 uncharacterized protein LOC115663860 [Syzygium oleosum]XP_056175162.1 uncharacterized protein LOC115663860 [Syzygium oleosum]